MRTAAETQSSEPQTDQSTQSPPYGCEGRSSKFAMADLAAAPCRSRPSPSRARARRVRFGPPDRLSPLGEVYLQPTLTAGHGTGEGGSRERGGEKMVWEPDRFNARVAHRLRGRPRFEPWN